VWLAPDARYCTEQRSDSDLADVTVIACMALPELDEDIELPEREELELALDEDGLRLELDEDGLLAALASVPVICTRWLRFSLKSNPDGVPLSVYCCPADMPDADFAAWAASPLAELFAAPEAGSDTLLSTYVPGVVPSARQPVKVCECSLEALLL
jgi:hypothetical protein